MTAGARVHCRYQMGWVSVVEWMGVVVEGCSLAHVALVRELFDVVVQDGAIAVQE